MRIALNLSKTLSIVRRGITYPIPLKNILYFSTQSGSSELWTEPTTYYCDESLLQWEEKLPASLFSLP